MSRFNTNAVSKESPDFFKTTHTYVNPARKNVHITRRLKPNLINSTSHDSPTMFHIDNSPLLDGKTRYFELVKGSNKASIIDQREYLHLYDRNSQPPRRATLDNIHHDHTIKKQIKSSTKLSLQADLMADKRPFYKANNLPFYKQWNQAAISKGFNIHAGNCINHAKQKKITRIDKQTLVAFQRSSTSAHCSNSYSNEELNPYSTIQPPTPRTQRRRPTIEDFYIELQLKNSNKSHQKCYIRHKTLPSRMDSRI